MPSAAQIAARLAVVPAAQAAQAQYGVPASVTLAQWEFESTWGTSQLAVEAKNFFGIKATHLAAPDTYEEFPTGEYISGKRVIVEALFAKYATEADSFIAHASLLANAARYAPAMAVRSDPMAFAGQLQACGYSTSPKYAEGLEEAIHAGNLTQYDLHPLPPAAEQVAA